MFMFSSHNPKFEAFLHSEGKDACPITGLKVAQPCFGKILKYQLIFPNKMLGNL